MQFAVSCLLGTYTQQLRRVLLGEQAAAYLIGLLGRTLFGMGLALAMLPYLQVGDAVLDSTTIGVPPERLVADPVSMAACYGALLLGFAIGLIVTGSAATRIGLGQTLRLREDQSGNFQH